MLNQQERKLLNILEDAVIVANITKLIAMYHQHMELIMRRQFIQLYCFTIKRNVFFVYPSQIWEKCSRNDYECLLNANDGW